MNEIITFFSDVPLSFRTSILLGGIVLFWILEGIVPLYSFNYKKNLAFGYVKSELSKEELAKKDLFIEVEKKKYLASIILEPLNNKNIREI